MDAPRRAVYLSIAILPVLGAPRLYGDLRQQLVERMERAKSSIDVVVYEIGSNEIADALIAAKHRGVRVRVIVDSVHSPSASSQERTLEDAGIEVKRIRGDNSRKLLHDKFILFDGSEATTPSYNRSVNSLRGEESEENAFFHEKVLIQKLQIQFNEFWETSGQNEVPAQ